MSALPKELNYTDKMQALPSNTKTISVVVAPVNGATFNTPGSDVIQFDLPSRGFLIPGSLYLRYKHTITKTTEPGFMVGTPAYTPFSRIETYIGPTIAESIQDYNQVCDMIINSKPAGRSRHVKSP
jgi:hypothetical protein